MTSTSTVNVLHAKLHQLKSKFSTRYDQNINETLFINKDLWFIFTRRIKNINMETLRIVDEEQMFAQMCTNDVQTKMKPRQLVLKLNNSLLSEKQLEHKYL